MTDTETQSQKSGEASVIWSDRLQASARVVAYVVPALYALGFVIVSQNLWSNGIGFVDPLKPRAFSAGALFVTLVGAANYFARPFATGPGNDKSKRYWPSWAAVWGVAVRAFVGLAFAQALHSYIGVDDSKFEYSWWRSGTLLVSLIPIAAAVVLSTVVRSSRSWLKALWATLFVAGVVLLGEEAIRLGAPFAPLAQWMVLAILSMHVHRWVLPLDRKEGDWSAVAFYGLGFLLGYSTSVYPTISPAWGGGAPVLARMEMLAAEGQGRRVEQVEIIDETQYGYFVRAEQGRGTLFVPRSRVGSVELRHRGRGVTVIDP